MSDILDIKKNYQHVLNIVKETATKYGRNPDDIKLIAVSKTKPIDYISQAIEAGAIDFGENKPQELSAKYDEISNVNWHLIGHLQKNKVRHIIGKTALIHSLDSIALASEIQKRAEKIDVIQDVLIQINISGEDSKFGINPKQLANMLSLLKDYENVNPIGLMTISVRDYSNEQNIELFKQLKKLADEYGLKELSMGMTNDYKEAIIAGSTMVRVGTAIFGQRDYTV